jgi:hypothetical protein
VMEITFKNENVPCRALRRLPKHHNISILVRAAMRRAMQTTNVSSHTKVLDSIPTGRIGRHVTQITVRLHVGVTA